MRETTKIKMEKIFSKKRLIFVLITALAFLAARSRTSLTDKESEFILGLKACREGKFHLAKDPPLPGLLYHGVFLLLSHLQSPLAPLLFNLIRPINVLLLSLTIGGVFVLLKRTTADILPLIIAIALAMDPFLVRLGLVSTNSVFALFFSIYSLVSLREGKEPASALLLGLAISSSWQSFSMYPLLLIALSISRFNMLINPKRAVGRTVIRIMGDAILFIAVPAALYTSFFLLHYSIQTHVSDSSNFFSVEFRATLVDPEQDSTDKYLMDRSIVTILNQRHRSYLSVEDGVPYGSAVKNAKSMWRIIKVHRVDEDNVGEEDPVEGRYIKNGDFVKITSFNDGRCLRMASEESDDKFKKIVSVRQEDDKATEEDLWVVVGEGRVLARESLVKFRHNKTQMELCMRNLQRSSTASERAINSSASEGKRLESSGSFGKYRKPVNGSIYSAHASRRFYISDNRNHDYYKNTFADGLPNEKTRGFPKVGFLRKFCEHHRRLLEMQSRSFYPISRAMVLAADMGHPLLGMARLVLSLLFPVLALFDRVRIARYGKGREMPPEYVLASVMYFSSILVGLCLCADLLYTTFLCVCSVWVFVSLFGSKASISVLVATLSSLAKDMICNQH
jgi:dolichyl-phosphate-mannose-protein mannosyltransferase